MSKFVKSYQAWLTVFMGSLYFFDLFAQMNIFNAVGDGMKQTMHLTDLDYSKLVNAFFYGNLLFLFPAGWLIDQVPTKRLLLILTALIGAATYIMGSIQTFYAMIWVRFFMGILGSFALLVVLKLVSQNFKNDQLAWVTGISVMIGVAGGCVSQAPMVWLVDHYGWQMSMQLYGWAHLPLWIMMILVVPKESGSHFSMNNQSLLDNLSEIGKVFANGQTWLSGLSISLMNLSVFVFGAWGISYLHTVNQLSRSSASEILAYFFVGMMLGSPIFGYLADLYDIWHFKRQPNRTIWMWVSSLGMLICLLWMIFSHASSFAVMVTLFFLIGLFSGGQCIGYTLVNEHSVAHLSARNNSLASFIVLAGGLIHPVVALLLSAPRPSFMVDFQMAFMLLPVGILCAMVCLAFIQETHGKNLSKK
jgi:MFS family permease